MWNQPSTPRSGRPWEAPPYFLFPESPSPGPYWSYSTPMFAHHAPPQPPPYYTFQGPPPPQENYNNFSPYSTYGTPPQPTPQSSGFRTQEPPPQGRKQRAFTPNVDTFRPSDPFLDGMPTDPYEILGVAPGGSEVEIKSAYRKKTRKYHPDKNPAPNARQMFDKLLEAYQYVMKKETPKSSRNIQRKADKARRKNQDFLEKQKREKEAREKEKEEAYNRQAEEEAEESNKRSKELKQIEDVRTPQTTETTPKTEAEIESEMRRKIEAELRDKIRKELEDELSKKIRKEVQAELSVKSFQDKKNNEDFKGKPCGISNTSKMALNTLKKRDPLFRYISLTLEEVFNGATKTMTHSKHIREDGRLKKISEVLTFCVPPGVSLGHEFCFREEGDHYPGCVPADVIYKVKYTRHEKFRKVDSDLHYTAKIGLCNWVHIPTMDGRNILLNLESPIPDGHVRVFPGRGFPYPNDPSRRGDFLVTFFKAYGSHQ